MNDKKNNIKEILGRNIRKYRELKGYTQESFIEKIGIGTSTISNIECGKSFPGPENLQKIIDVLEVSPELLFAKDILVDEKFMFEDFKKRFNLIKNNKEKFEILYNVLKVLS